MPRGLERYDAVIAHERGVKAKLLGIAASVFPELACVEKWPEVYLTIPDLEATHATRYVEATI